MVNSVWHRAVLLSWGELTAPFLAPKRHSQFPDDLLRGIRLLRIDHFCTSMEAVRLYTTLGKPDGKAFHLPRFWRILLNSDVLREISVGEYLGVSRDTETFDPLPLSMGCSSVISSLCSWASRAGLIFSGVKTLMDCVPKRDQEREMLGGGMLRMFGGGFGGMAQPSDMVHMFSEEEIRNIEKTFPALETLGFVFDAMLHMIPNACWKTTLREVNLGNFPLQRLNCLSLLRKAWPHLRKIVMDANCRPRYWTRAVLRDLLEGIAKYGIGPLPELHLSIMLDCLTPNPRDRAAGMTPFNLVDEIGVIQNVSSVFLLLAANVPMSLFQQVGQFVQNVGDIRITGLIIDPIDVFEGISNSGLILNSFDQVYLDSRDCLEEEQLLSVRIARGLMAGGTRMFRAFSQRPFLPPDRENFVPPASYQREHGMNQMPVDFLFDSENNNLILTFQVIAGYGLSVVGVPMLYSAQEFLYVGEFNTTRTLETRHLLFARDPFCNFATRSVLLLSSNESVNRISIVQSISHEAVNRPSDPESAWNTAARRAFFRLLEQAGFVAVSSADQKAVRRAVCRARQSTSIVGKLLNKEEWEGALVTSFVRLGPPRDVDLSLFKFLVMVVEEEKGATTGAIRLRRYTDAVRGAYLMVDAVDFLRKVFLGRLPPPRKGRAVKPLPVDLSVLVSLKTAVLMNLVLCYYHLQQPRLGLQTGNKLLCDDVDVSLTEVQKAKLYFRMGMLYELKQQFPQAVSAYRSALRFDQENRAVRSRLSKILKIVESQS